MERKTKNSPEGKNPSTRKKPASPGKQKSAGSPVDVKGLRERIAVRAYALYERRGYTHGDDLKDWFEAEQRVLTGPEGAGRTSA